MEGLVWTVEMLSMGGLCGIVSCFFLCYLGIVSS